MFKFNELRQVHLEITNNCQASCPMCSRNHHGGQDNPLLNINNWSLAHYKNTMTEDVLKQIEAVFFCGNFGDPLLNKDLLDMCSYTTATNPNLQIRIHTNGSIHNPDWWTRLAGALPKNHIVIFGVDGLEDTNHIYRVGTNFKKIMENASAFIQAGGRANWTYIVFKHNEHQVEQARQMSIELGFEIFTRKNSSRFLLDESFPVLDKSGNVAYKLEPASESKIVFIDRKVVENYKQIVAASEIDCHALNSKEVYIDAFGRLFPCCWLASTPYNYTETTSEIAGIRQVMLDQYNSMIEDFGGIDNIDTKYNSIESIIDSDAYQTIWSKYWSDPKMVTCARICGKNKLSKPMDQFEYD
jgi:MoaA/NifB/PqqE/SkfB family radical SAM enzyme